MRNPLPPTLVQFHKALVEQGCRIGNRLLLNIPRPRKRERDSGAAVAFFLQPPRRAGEGAASGAISDASNFASRSIRRRAKLLVRACRHAAMKTPVGQIDHESRHHPHEKPNPRNARQTRHQVAAEEHTEDRYQRYQWRAKGPVKSRLHVTQDPRTQAYQHECKERPDIRQLRDLLDRRIPASRGFGFSCGWRRDL